MPVGDWPETLPENTVITTPHYNAVVNALHTAPINSTEPHNYNFKNIVNVGLLDCQDLVINGDFQASGVGGIRFFTGVSPTTLVERMRIDPVGYVGIGTSAPLTKLHVVYEDVPAGERGIMIGQHNNGAQAAILYGQKSRGTLAAPLSVQAGDNLLNLNARAYATTMVQRASIVATVSAPVSADIVPTSWDFNMQGTDGSSATRMRLTHDGNLGIGTLTPLGRLHVINENIPIAPNLRGVVIEQNSSNVNSAILYFRKSRGTAGAPTPVAFGDNLAVINAFGLGTQMAQRASIIATVSAAVSGDIVPTSWNIELQGVDGVIRPRFRLQHDGRVGINNLGPSYYLDIACDPVGGSVGDVQNVLRTNYFEANSDNLQLFTRRTAATTGWGSVEWIWQRRVDVSPMGYLGFKGTEVVAGVGLTEHLRIHNGGVTVNSGVLHLTGTGLSSMNITGANGLAQIIKPGGSFEWFRTDTGMYGGPNSSTLAVLDSSGRLFFGASTRQMLNLFGAQYAIGVQSFTLYSRSASNFAWHRGGVHGDGNIDPGGGALAMYLDANSDLIVAGKVKTGGHQWNGAHLIIGDFHFWVDSSGRLWMKNAQPSSQTDGSLVGAQS